MSAKEALVIGTRDIQPENQPSPERVLSLLDLYYGKRERYFSEDHHWENWQIDLGDEAEEITDHILKYEEKVRGEEGVTLAADIGFSKCHPQSIVWEAVWVMSWAWFRNLLPDDLPYLRKFLLTPPGKELEGWAEWEAYWSSRHSPKE